MAKQLYEKKVVTNLCGILIKNEDNSYTVSVADKDDITEYDLNEIFN